MAANERSKGGERSEPRERKRRTARYRRGGACNNPRQIRILLENLRDIALCDDDAWQPKVGYSLGQVLDDHGLTEDGLTATAQRYLLILHDEWNGEPAGGAAMKERLREPGGLDYTERLLLEKGLIALTKRGRVLTQSGIKRAGELSQAA